MRDLQAAAHGWRQSPSTINHCYRTHKPLEPPVHPHGPARKLLRDLICPSRRLERIISIVEKQCGPIKVEEITYQAHVQ